MESLHSHRCYCQQPCSGPTNRGWPLPRDVDLRFKPAFDARPLVEILKGVWKNHRGEAVIDWLLENTPLPIPQFLTDWLPDPLPNPVANCG